MNHLGLEWRWAALKNGFIDTMAYRWEFLFEVLGYMAVPASVQLVLWYALFQSGGNQFVAGHSFHEMVSYTVLTVLFSQIRGGNHDFELQDAIRTGSLSQYLLRPISVIEFTYIRGVSGKLLIASVCLVVGMILLPILGFSPLRMFGAMAMAILGNIIHYLVGAAIASAAFYWEEAYSILMVKNMVVDFLSGELVPLFLFPASMSWIWKSTPFYLYVYGPVQFATGFWTVETYLQNFGIGLLWAIGMGILVKITWSIGIRRYSSLGG